MKQVTVDTRTVVVGLGKTGMSCVRYLSAKGCLLSVVDSRQSPPLLEEFRREFPQIPCHLGELSETVLASAADIVVSPGVSLEEPEIAAAIAAGSRLISDIDLFRAEVSAPIIAITGSNGKSTVTTLVGEMAKCAGVNVAVAGNIGLPVLELLDEQGNEDTQYALYVIELSSFQLERCAALDASVAVILNVSSDHIDRYPDFDSYRLAKQRIFHGVGKIVLNRAERSDWPLVSKDVQCFSYGFGMPGPQDVGVVEEDGEQFIVVGEDRIMAVSELKIFGQHNVENALAALALGWAADIPKNSMLEALIGFNGLPHRCQYVATRKGVDFYDDSKGTNVGATIAAIEGLGKNCQGKLVLIAGGEGKGADFAPLVEPVSRYCRGVVLIGNAAPQLTAIFTPVVTVESAQSMEAAVEYAVRLAGVDDAVLLSPACASFDMFKNFEHRGDMFVAAVRALDSNGVN